jgi:acetolactate synthase I/II/III large subunit
MARARLKWRRAERSAAAVMKKDQTMDRPSPDLLPATGAESVLMGLRRAGVDYLFANAGTDFPPIIEAMAQLPAGAAPEPVTVPHETAGIAMAHGYYLATGRPQAVMVHVNVGLANTAMGVINAASDNIPVLVLSGRTPITERGRPGSRMTPIQYGQEMYDQASLVSDVCRFHYEMRYPEQGGPLVARAAAIALSEPRGPVYLSLPREPLSEAVPPELADWAPQGPATPSMPDPRAVETLARWLEAAEAPAILCQRGDPQGRLGAALAAFAERHGIAVAEPFTIRNLLPSDHPMHLGYAPGPALAEADLVLVLDSGVPWIEAAQRPRPGARVAHIGPEPVFARMPVRGYRSDLALTGEPAAAIAALDAALPAPGAAAADRRARVAERAAARREAAEAEARAGAESPMTAEWMSLCLGEALGRDGVVFSELGVVPGATPLGGANRLFSNPHSGGLGWALPAALGAQLADRDRLVVACIGDGSYMFANPVACHQIAEALELPVVTVVKNNRLWNAVRRSVVNAYPDGAAARANRMPLTSLEPSPDYLAVASASRAHVERVEHGRDLPGALARAIDAARTDRRQALVDVNIAVSDRH